MRHDLPSDPPEVDEILQPGPLRLSHVMIGVAIIALAIGLTPRLVESSRYTPSFVFRWPAYVYYATAFLLVLTGMVAPLGFYEERRRSALSFRSYGAAAVLAMVAGLGLLMVRALIFTLDDLRETTTPFMQSTIFVPGAGQFVARSPETFAGSILAAWTLLAVTGQGRKPAGWLEWTYFGLGAAWIFAALFHDSIGVLRIGV